MDFFNKLTIVWPVIFFMNQYLFAAIDDIDEYFWQGLFLYLSNQNSKPNFMKKYDENCRRT